MKNVLFILFGSAFSSGLGFLFQIILARNLNTSTYGIYTSTFYLINILMPLCGFGAAQLILRKFGEYGQSAKIYIKPIYTFSLISTFMVLIIIITISLNHPKDERGLVLGIGTMAITYVLIELTSCYCQLEERYKLLAFWSTIQNLLRISLLFIFLIYLDQKIYIEHINKIFIITALIIIVLTIKPISQFYKNGIKNKKFNYSNNKKELEKQSLFKIAKESFPFGMAGIFFLLNTQFSIVIIKNALGSEQAALYSIGFIIINSSLIIPGIIYNKYLAPKIHRWAYQDLDKMKKTYNAGNRYMFLLGTLIAGALIAINPFFIPLAFGKEYTNSVHVASILSINIPIIFLASSAGATLVTKNHINKKILYMAVAAAFNIVVSLILVAKTDISGIAWISILSNLLLTYFYYQANKKHVFKENYA